MCSSTIEYSLYIDTHDNFLRLVLFKNGKVSRKLIKESEQSHSTNTMPGIESLLKDENIKVNDLNEILVGNGPGSFTGIRIAVTIAKGLAYTLSIPIKTITSLKALAVGSNLRENKLAVVSDRNGKYIGEFDSNNNEIDEIKYLKNLEFDDYVKNKNIQIVENIDLDFETIYNYLRDEKVTNVHEVKPFYVKNIEVQSSGKKS